MPINRLSYASLLFQTNFNFGRREGEKPKATPILQQNINSTLKVGDSCRIGIFCHRIGVAFYAMISTWKIKLSRYPQKHRGLSIISNLFHIFHVYSRLG